MRKLVTLFLVVGLILLGGTSSAFAQANVGNNTDFFEELDLSKDAKSNPRFIALKEFIEEFHIINDLLIEGHELKIDLTEKKDVVLDLTLAAYEISDFEALKSARDVSKEIKIINNQITVFREQIKTERDLFNQSIKNNELDVAQEHINTTINLTDSINQLTEQKLIIYDNIIDILSR
ncbi:MAG: hypothetical protein AB7V16_09965 [Vulcanibacillus sp.]